MDAALTAKILAGVRLTGGPFQIPCRAETLIADDLNIPNRPGSCRVLVGSRERHGRTGKRHDFQVGRARGPRGNEALGE